MRSRLSISSLFGEKEKEKGWRKRKEKRIKKKKSDHLGHCVS
jgi:hypothetical protein